MRTVRLGQLWLLLASFEKKLKRAKQYKAVHWQERLNILEEKNQTQIYVPGCNICQPKFCIQNFQILSDLSIQLEQSENENPLLKVSVYICLLILFTISHTRFSSLSTWKRICDIVVQFFTSIADNIGLNLAGWAIPAPTWWFCVALRQSVDWFVCFYIAALKFLFSQTKHTSHLWSAEFKA